MRYTIYFIATGTHWCFFQFHIKTFLLQLIILSIIFNCKDCSFLSLQNWYGRLKISGHSSSGIRPGDIDCHFFMPSGYYSDVTMGSIASQITSITIVYSSVYSSADQRKHQSSASLAFVRGIRRRPVNSPHKGPVTRKMFPFDDVVMCHIFVFDEFVL